MAKAKPITLSAEEVKRLEAITRARTSQAQLVAIADEGITVYDVYFVQENFFDDGGWSVSELENMKYNVTGNQHIEFNPDEGVYEIDINLELTPKASTKPDITPEPTVTPELTITKKPAITLDTVPTSVPVPTTAQASAVNVVNTGDASPVGTYLMLMFAALAGIAGSFVSRKRCGSFL